VPEAHAHAYASVRRRTSRFVVAADSKDLDRPAPATPEWRARDIVAHMVGVTDDVINGRLEGIATNPWTDAQVEARRTMSIDDMLAEWEERSPQFEEMLVAAPEAIAGQGLFDAFTHEQDLRHAIGVPGARDSDAMEIGWGWISGARTRSELPALRFVTEQGEMVVGSGEPRATVGASRFELLRACTGRRSASEIAAYRWDAAPEPELLLAGPIFCLRAEPLNE
jgi:uncharacterized protein (TIGR03083 family)